MAEQRFWGLGRAAPADRANGDDTGLDGNAGPAGVGAAAHGAAGSGPGRDAPGVAPAPRRIRPTSDPAAVVRSLGAPPLAVDSALAERHLTAVYEEAVRAATALAAATGLLAADDSSDSGAPD